MRRILKSLAGAALTLVLALGAVVALFLARPEVLLTSRTMGAAIGLLGKSYAPHWKSLRFSAASIARRRHRYTLSAADFCVADPRRVFSACFSELELSVVVFYSRRGPLVERIERLVAVSRDARLDLRARAPRPGVMGFPSVAPVQELRVELSSFTFAAEKSSASGSLRVILASTGRRPLAVAADIWVRSSGGSRRLKAELTADTDLLKGGVPTFIDFAGRGDYGPGGLARAAFRVQREALRFVATGGAEIELPGGALRELRLAACEGSAPLSVGAAWPSGAELACRYELVSAKAAPAPFASVKGATGRVTLSGGLEKGRFSAALKASLDPIVAWCELSGDLAARVSGRVDRPLKDAVVSHEVRASVKVPHFEDLVAFLRETRFSVPAPVHILKGPLSLTLESRGDPRAASASAHYVFSSDLSGTRQKLVVRAEGDVTALNALATDRSFAHSGTLLLKEVALELPRLDIGRTPKVFFDKRIKTGAEEPAAAAPAESMGPKALRPLPLRGSLIVKTEKPLILFSNLARDPIPLALDLVASFPPASAAGRIMVRQFGVELFRRNAIVDHLIVALSSASKSGALEGLVRYETPSAEIRILIRGTTEKPLISFTSSPPMKREDIISLLIFGKSPDELDPEQTASVSNTETALENRAFGLASLYLFGATPIEHVGYDSATKTTSVRLRLPGGANLTLGSDFDMNRQLTVRKPLAPHWAIQSEFTDQGQQSKVATTFLEWFNRY